MPKLTRKPKAVLFDLDGTLANTFPLIVTAWNAAVSPHTGRSYTAAEVVSRFGIPDVAMIRRELPGPASEQAVKSFLSYYETQHDQIQLFEGVTELLNLLKRNNNRLAIVTGKGGRCTEITVEKLNWKPLFDAVVHGEDTPHQKPHPEPLLIACRRLEVDPTTCIFVGDSPADINAARAAGMPSIAATWDSPLADQAILAKPDFIAAHPSEVARLLTEADSL